ncbi:MAG: NADH-quinone oxidoreductase subunit NuoE [Cohaesibacteraceae bacterium]|nr:NADH-quinone oxidoreductase subunit NuoE [Cohaesibacteraceae bacterium]
MAVRRLHQEQPESFEFSPENLDWARLQIAKYPEGREASAVILLLWRAQEQHAGWLPEPAMRYIADMLGMAYIRVLEVATFYTMFQLSPVGKKAHIQVCGTTPCQLRGAEDLIEVCKKRISNHPHSLSANGDFSWEEVECLGACVNAPMIQIFKDTYEDLGPAAFEDLITDLEAGRQINPGPQIDRVYAMPAGGTTSLTDPSLYDGSMVKHGLPVKSDTDNPAIGSKEADTEANIFLSGPRGKPDDLKKISGVGKVLETKLNNLGIYHYQQIADFTKQDIDKIDGLLRFKGRIARESWLEQAVILASGNQTEFSSRVANHKVPSSSNEGDK